MSLLALYEGMEKTASQNNLHYNDEWAQAAAEYGMTTDQFMDKLAEQQVREEVEMVKQAQEATWLGKCMGSGYVDTLVKVACADPVRDEIPEIHIKVAQASLDGLVNHMVKAANAPAKAEAILAALKGYGSSALDKADDLILRAQGATGLGARGKMVDDARQLLGGMGKMDIAIDKLTGGAHGKMKDLRGIHNKLRDASRGFKSRTETLGGLGGFSPEMPTALTEMASKAKVQDELRRLLSNMGSKGALAAG